MLEHSTLKEIQLQTSAAQIENQSRLQAIVQRPFHRRADQPGLFLIADHFQLEAGFPADAVHQFAIVSGFSSGCGCDGAISADLITVHTIAKLLEGASCSRNGVVIEQSAGKGVVAQTDRGTLVVKDLDMLRRSGTGNDEPNGIGARIDRG
jgi:hypothetical protein